jgi:hypothetical protein
MKWKNYLVLCALVALVVSGAIVLVPGLSETLETRLITFLSTNAS